MSDKKVIPLIYKDYSNWHKNRAYFGLWYIKIDNPMIINDCQHKQSQLQNFLMPNYNRQFHITLFVNGFWVTDKQYDDDFNQADLNEQIEQLKKLKLNKFKLSLEKLYAFDNCLSIKTSDNEYLTTIRKTLQSTHNEISPSDYIPHITLGFYKGDFLKQTIIHHIQKIPIQALSFEVKTLTFGVYDVKALQGKLSPVFELYLE